MLYTRIFHTMLFCIVLKFPGFSQSSLTGFDQIKISKISQEELTYAIGNPQLRQAALKIYSPRKEKKSVSYLLDDFSQSMLARIFGNSSSHKDRYFRIPVEVSFNEKNPVWKANLYAFGNLEKIRTKKQEFENTKILIKDKNLRMDWGLDTWCTLEEEKNIIGGFSIKVNPFADSNFLKTAYYTLEPEKEKSWVKIKHPFDSLRQIDEFKAPDYGAVGLMKDVPYVLLYYADQKKLWVFLDAIPVAFFRIESTEVELISENGRTRYVAHQYPPELWIRHAPDEKEKVRIIRLALFSRLMIWTLNQREISY